ncbi:MAG: D-amino acid aminotransferase [Hyphomicrobium sp. 32-62-53]|nr:MAG: D-amino acid aminotransferase [Hyphomicrobium sp. 12-62-95]OYX99480.1 MAG: D-amino acid aminotransferase [Hyphomicrobium sp. 32-62-53]
MARIVYVNGRYLPYAEAGVHVEDRGFQFADSVYEVCEVKSGALIDTTRHLARLDRSLAELKIAKPMSDAALRHVLAQIVRRNRVRDGLVYLQVTRGKAARDFLFPGETDPTLVALARPIDPYKVAAKAKSGIAVKTVPDPRWGRCDLKTVMLLPAALAKETAREAGAQEAWFVDEKGFVTEGASSNAWIVRPDGFVLTRPLDNRILGGVTRATLLDLLKAQGVPVEQRPFTVPEAQAAREAFVTSASATVMPVVSIDGHKVAEGRPGDLTKRLREKFHDLAEITPV